MISPKNKKYADFEKLLYKNYRLWGLDNLDFIEILDGLRELKNARKQRMDNSSSRKA